MKAKLIIILELTHYTSANRITSYYKDVELLVSPSIGMHIKVGEIDFSIDDISQNLNSKTVILRDHGSISSKKAFIRESENLSEAGWKKCLKKMDGSYV